LILPQQGKRRRMPRRSEAEAGLRMHHVYMLRSESHLDRFYVGVTADWQRRLEEHNSGKSIHTNKYRPWKVVTYVAFSDRQKAEKFELYLKSGSGRSFAKKHF
jgi:predicted GIY-YIG superfamily endonuclease